MKISITELIDRHTPSVFKTCNEGQDFRTLTSFPCV